MVLESPRENVNFSGGTNPPQCHAGIQCGQPSVWEGGREGGREGREGGREGGRELHYICVLIEQRREISLSGLNSIPRFSSLLIAGKRNGMRC